MEWAGYGFGALIAFALGTLYARKGGGGGNIERYRHTQPALDLREFFQGNLTGFGIIEDISGKVMARYTSDITASWQGDTLTLHEDTLYDHGGREQRTLAMTCDAQDNLTCAAPDIAAGARGRIRGNAAQLRYHMTRTIQGRSMGFGIDEWVYRVDAKHMVKKIRMHKLGFTVARMTVGIYKRT